MTVDENLKPLSVPVRVGQAVDVVGQAGRPKTITGFQTHSTPVLLAAGDRAELATEKYSLTLQMLNVNLGLNGFSCVSWLFIHVYCAGTSHLPRFLKDL